MIYAKTLRKIIICPTCQGEGTIKVGNLRENHNHDIEPCRDCDGKGKVKRIVTIQYEKL
jgi:DnaJ-class molecular chaperone